MSKRLKLSLDELEVQSFVTTTESNKVIGGDTGVSIGLLPCSICFIYHLCVSDFGQACHTSPVDNCPSQNNTQCFDCPTAGCFTPGTLGGCCGGGGNGESDAPNPCVIDICPPFYPCG